VICFSYFNIHSNNKRINVNHLCHLILVLLKTKVWIYQVHLDEIACVCFRENFELFSGLDMQHLNIIRYEELVSAVARTNDT
jgi:hypothetical protein